MCFPSQCWEPGRWSRQSTALHLCRLALAATSETVSVGPAFLRHPKFISAIIASKARSALAPAVPEHRDGGLHKTSAISSKSGLAGVHYLFIPLLYYLMFDKKPTLRARAPSWRPKATSCCQCNSTLSSSLISPPL